MNHPYEQLVGLVDGTLDEDALARVRSHLDACETCREDVALATAGRAAARSLPSEPAPADLPERVLREAGGGRGRAAPSWYRWAGAAAAAALVIGLAFALPDVGNPVGDERAEDATAAGAQVGVEAGGERAGDVPFAEQDRDYDEDDLRELARGGGAATLDAPQPAAAESSRSAAGDAIACVNEAFESAPSGRLVRVIDARFRGRDAYIALYLEGPGADQPPDTAAVWVAAEDDCTPLTFASARLSS